MARQDSLGYDTQMSSKWQDWCAQVHTLLCLFDRYKNIFPVIPLERWMQGHNAGHTAIEASFYYTRSVFWPEICWAAPETHWPVFPTLGHGSLHPAMFISHGYPLWLQSYGTRCVSVSWNCIDSLLDRLHLPRALIENMCLILRYPTAFSKCIPWKLQACQPHFSDW